AAVGARGGAAAGEFVHLPGERHVARRRADGTRDFSGGAAHPGRHLSAAGPVPGSRLPLPDLQHRADHAAGAAGTPLRAACRCRGGAETVALQGSTRRVGELQVQNDVDVDSAQGSVPAPIGPSGSDKGTLLGCVNPLETPDARSQTVGSATLTFAGTAPPNSA